MQQRCEVNRAEIIAELQSLGNEALRSGMARFGIKTEQALGISMGTLRQMARCIGKKNHVLAEALWDTGLHEARLLATIVDDAAAVTEEQVERWVSAFDSWDLCDQCCGNLFDKTPYAWDKAVEWSARKKEYEKRAEFVLMACLAVHDKNAPDERYLPYLDIIKREADDRRNYMRKAVNWALRETREAEWLAQSGGARNRSGDARSGRQEHVGCFGRSPRADEREGAGQTQGTR